MVFLVLFALACSVPHGLDPLIQPGSVLLVGEIHGTAESPAFVARAACLALKAGRSVTVALEIPREEEGRMTAYLSSAGTVRDRARLLAAGSFWADPYQDGRRSEAMFILVESLRELGHKGTLHVVLLDAKDAAADNRGRDAVMADSLTAALERWPGDVLIALTGNLHSRVTAGSMGFFFAQANPDARITALDVAYAAGTAWVCTSGDASSCKARALHGAGDEGGLRVILHPLRDGYHGVYNVGPITASPPAISLH
jgi:hypothetical protein